MNWLAVDEDDAVLASVAVQDIRQDDGSARSATGSRHARAAAGSPPARSASPPTGRSASWGCERIEIMTHEDNAASQGVARAAGYAETGERRVPPREGLPPGRYVVFTPPA